MGNSKIASLEEHPLNAKPDIPDFRDFIYQPALIRLEARLDRPKELMVLDQGSEGACTGFGLAAAINMLNHRRQHSYQVSARMLYEMAKRHDEWPGQRYAGSSCRGAIKGWYAMGVCRDKDWPYRPNPGELTIRRAKKARENTLGAYFRLQHKVSHFHTALNEVGAVFVSAMVHGGWDRSRIKDGIITPQEEILGGHAFAIIGYDDKGFLVQNSWGEKWGEDGVATWLYEDWQKNIRDAWVFRLALPTPQIWHNPPNQYSVIQNDREQSGRSPARAEIAGHFVHIDDGDFHEHGRYWSTAHDTRQTAELIAESDKYDHLLLYAHGGLNSPKDSASRISAMRDTFKQNRIYPYHIMYDTGLLEELKDVVFGKKDQAEARAGGFSDWTDRLLERGTRIPGRALWREMKYGARRPFDSGKAGETVIEAFVKAFRKAGHSLDIHLAGHSTGAILMAYLAATLKRVAPQMQIESCSLMAPAASVALFENHYLPLLKRKRGFGIDRMTIYNLDDQLEKDDNVAKVYRKSLLYLVSRAFEEQIPEAILGMEIHNGGLRKRAGKRLTVVYSHGSEASGGKRSCATSHGGFDNDVATMNDILRNILGGKPKHPFEPIDLGY